MNDDNEGKTNILNFGLSSEDAKEEKDRESGNTAQAILMQK